MSPVPRVVTVITDTREQSPVLFPVVIDFYPERHAGSKKTLRVVNVRRKLDAGDYALLGYESNCIIERKGSLRELANNFLSDDYSRASAALTRLAGSCRHPYLLIDDTLADMSLPTVSVPLPGLVLDVLIRETTRRGINLLWVSCSPSTKGRVRLGTALLHLMLNHALAEGAEK